MEELLVQLSTVAVFGIGAQWLAWRLKLPSILLLLLIGFLLGPVLGFINPDALLGESLFPLVSLAVGIILFEGGLTLKIKDLPVSGRVIFRLISVGALVTWIIAALGAHYVLNFEWPIAVLIGAILIVTGPTVVGPLLRQIRPKGRTGAILRWEGILIDPVGAVLAVLVFEVIRLGEVGSVPGFILLGVLRSLFVGLFFGLLGAGILITLLRRHLIPDFLQNGVTLLFVLGSFAISDLLAPEGGLLTVTVMGVAMANQPWVSIRHILEFKENLQVLLVGVLFILLAGRVDIENLTQVGWGIIVFVVILVLLARPLGVIISTWRTPLSRAERIFLMWMAPRGIVAASVASVFAFELTEIGLEGAEKLAPIIFLVIVGTVIFYGLTAGPVARRLELAEQDPQGALIVGGHPFARDLAEQLRRFGFRAVIVDTNHRNIVESRLAGLEAVHGNALSEKVLSEMDLGGVGRLLALTGNDEVNALTVLSFLEVFGRSEVYQLSSAMINSHSAPTHLRGRPLFDTEVTYDFLTGQMEKGATVKATSLTSEFSYSDYLAQNRNRIVPLCLISENRRLIFFTLDANQSPKAGQTVVSLFMADHVDG